MAIPPDHPDYLSPEELRDLPEKIRKEADAIISAIGRVTTAWAELEEKLFELFAELSEIKKLDVAGVIFYTPTNTETRIALVNSLFALRFRHQQKGEVDATFLSIWKKTRSKIDGLKSTRNAIVHGTMTQFAGVEGLKSQRPRITPSFFDSMRFWKSFKSGQHIGLGSSEIESHWKATRRVTERVDQLKLAARIRLITRATRLDGETARMEELLAQLTAEN